MLVFNILLVLTAVNGLLAALFWVRVAASPSLDVAGRLDGTEKIFERANRRAIAGAWIATGLTVVLAAGAYLIGRSAGAL